MRERLLEFLNEEMRRRDLSMNKVARMAGISSGLISGVMSGTVPASANFCIAVARALRVPPEHVLRLAGILPPSVHEQAEQDPATYEAYSIMAELEPHQKAAAVSMLRGLAQMTTPTPNPDRTVRQNHQPPGTKLVGDDPELFADVMARLKVLVPERYYPQLADFLRVLVEAKTPEEEEEEQQTEAY